VYLFLGVLARVSHLSPKSRKNHFKFYHPHLHNTGVPLSQEGRFFDKARNSAVPLMYVIAISRPPEVRETCREY
jgi:hypothetical protein